MILRLSGIFLLSILMAACSPPPYTNLNNDQLKAKLEQGTPLYDIRRPEEWYQTGVIEQSNKLTYADASGRLNPQFFKKFTAAINKDDPVILICLTGSRTDSLARHLINEMGYTQVYNVRHGMSLWIGENRPIIRL